MNAPVAWSFQVEEYLAYRRRLGFELASQAHILRHFARFAEQMGQQIRLTVALTLAWVRATKQQQPISMSNRIRALRGFAQYLLRLDPTTEIPPPDLFGPVAYRRRVPHIFSNEELIALMDETEDVTMHNRLRPQTCRSIFGLLAASGLRVAEAIKLERTDVDLNAGVLTIREAKFHKSRIVPLHSSATAALQSYAQLRDHSAPLNNSDRFFLFDQGNPANGEAVLDALQRLCKQRGWRPRGEHPHHRLQDLRHTFIVRSMVRSYQQGIEIDRAILALSTYVGHSSVAETYWYCTAIPELMSIAAERFHHYSQGEPL
jgi:integrase